MKISKLKDLLKFNLRESNTDNIVAYHGTDRKFSVFDDSKPIFFVNDPNVAKTYGPNVVKVKLKMENPIEFDFANGSTYMFDGKWYVPSKLAQVIKDIADDLEKYGMDEDTRELLGEYGFEDSYGDLNGIIMYNINDVGEGMFSDMKPATNYVVFDKSQITLLT